MFTLLFLFNGRSRHYSDNVHHCVVGLELPQSVFHPDPSEEWGRHP